MKEEFVLLLKLFNDGRELNAENISTLATKIDFGLGILRIFSCQKRTYINFGNNK